MILLGLLQGFKVFVMADNDTKIQSVRMFANVFLLVGVQRSKESIAAGWPSPAQSCSTFCALLVYTAFKRRGGSNMFHTGSLLLTNSIQNTADGDYRHVVASFTKILCCQQWRTSPCIHAAVRTKT